MAKSSLNFLLHNSFCVWYHDYDSFLGDIILLIWLKTLKRNNAAYTPFQICLMSAAFNSSISVERVIFKMVSGSLMCRYESASDAQVGVEYGRERDLWTPAASHRLSEGDLCEVSWFPVPCFYHPETWGELAEQSKRVISRSSTSRLHTVPMIV